MNRISRTWAIWLLFGLAIAAVIFHYRNDERQIQQQLERLAEACSFEGSEKTPARAATLSSALKQGVWDNVTLDIAGFGESTFKREDLLQGYYGVTEQFRSLRLVLSHPESEVDADRKRAVARAMLLVEKVEDSGASNTEPRQLVTTLEKRGDAWVVVHAKLSMPRIDQPEARP